MSNSVCFPLSHQASFSQPELYENYWAEIHYSLGHGLSVRHQGTVATAWHGRSSSLQLTCLVSSSSRWCVVVFWGSVLTSKGPNILFSSHTVAWPGVFWMYSLSHPAWLLCDRPDVWSGNYSTGSCTWISGVFWGNLLYWSIWILWSFYDACVSFLMWMQLGDVIDRKKVVNMLILF